MFHVHRRVIPLVALLASVVSLFGASYAVASLSLTPGQVTNDYSGPLDLTITGLDSNGQTVVLEEYLDLDDSGTINAGDFLIRKLLVTDGQVTSIAGHRNVNIPGDEDGLADSTIHTRLLISAGGVDRIDGRHIFRVSPNGGVGFAPATADFVVAQKDYAGSGVSGTVTGNATAQPGAFVFLMTAGNGGDMVALTVTGAGGNYSFKAPAGRYQIVASKSGFVFDSNSLGTFTVTAGTFTTGQNAVLTPSQRTISGQIRDATTLAGLPAVAMEGQSQTGFIALTIADGGGNFVMDAMSGGWQFNSDEHRLSQFGVLQAKTTESSAGNVSAFNIDMVHATSLIYGSVKTAGNVVVPFAEIKGQQNGGVGLKPIGLSDGNGNYALGVVPGSWRIEPQQTSSFLFDNPNDVIVNTDASAVPQDIVAHPITAHLRGQIRDNQNNPVGDVSVVAVEVTNGNGIASIATADANGFFDIGVYGNGGTNTKDWTVSLLISNEAPANFVSTQPVFHVQDGVDINGIAFLVYPVTAHLRGQVLDENNAPITNVAIYANKDNGMVNTGADTDGSGNFNIPIFGGTWNLGLSNIQGLGLIPQDYSIVVQDNVDQNNLVFRAYHSTANISGVVKNSSNVGLSGIMVSGATTINGANYSSSTTTDPNGNYSLAVAAANWVVSVDNSAVISRGYAPLNSQNVFVSGNVSGINFIAVNGTRISSVTRLGNGHIMVLGTGVPNTTYHIQITSTLAAAFTDVNPAVTANSSGLITYEDASPGTRRFYRINSP